MSTKRENSILESSGEGRTFTTNTREGGKEAAPDRLGKPGPQNGPESGGGEGSSGQAENHCTPEQEKLVSTTALVALIVEALRSLFDWLDAWGQVGGAENPVQVGRRLESTRAEATTRALALQAALPLVPDGNLDARLNELGRWLTTWGAMNRASLSGRADDAEQKPTGAHRGGVMAILNALAAAFDWQALFDGDEGKEEATAHLHATLNLVRKAFGSYSIGAVAEALGHLTGRAERARNLELKCTDLESGRAKLEAELKATAWTANERQRIIDDLREHLNRTHAETTELACKVDALTKERDALSERVAVETASAKNLQQLGAKLQAERDALSERVEVSTATAKSLQRFGAKLQTARVKSLEAELAGARDALMRQRARNVEILRQRNRLQAEYLSNLTEHGKFASDLAAMLKEYETRAESLERTREEREVLQNRYADLERACTALREELDAAHRTAERGDGVKEDLHAKIGDLCPACVTELIDVGREALKAWRAWSGDKRRGDMACWWERTVDLRSQCDEADDHETNLSCTHTRGGAS